MLVTIIVNSSVSLLLLLIASYLSILCVQSVDLLAENSAALFYE